MALGLIALNSDVLSPADGDTVPAGPVEVRGYAFAGGERHVLWNPKGYVNNARPRVRVRATAAER
jgi:hypothetical protein